MPNEAFIPGDTVVVVPGIVRGAELICSEAQAGASLYPLGEAKLLSGTGIGDEVTISPGISIGNDC